MSSTSADFQNLYQALSRSATRSPDALALAFEDRRYLYRDFHQRVQQAMAQLDQVWSLRQRRSNPAGPGGIIPLFAKSYLPRWVWASKWCLSALSLSRPKARNWWVISPPGPCCSMRPCRTG